MANGPTPRLVDGQADFSGGIDSGRPTTIQTPANVHGIPRNMLAWLTNATVRGGGIRTRTGWNQMARFDPQLFQGGFMYEPDNGLPYLIVSIAGRIYQIRVDSDNSIVDLSAAFGLTNPATIDKAFFAQGEQFLVIQAGDYGQIPNPTLPLFWDGATLRRSSGITNTAVAPGSPGVNEIPAATSMVYYAGRLWYSQGRTYSAGDIVRGTAGTGAFGFRDAILNVTENPLCVGGDGFTVPTNAGTIRALAFTANLDTTLGQGPLYIFTPRQIYALSVPVTRADWIAATNNNGPLQTVSQIRYGAVSDRSVVHSNGDLYYRTLEPGIRSLILAIRYFSQFGNTPISRNMNRVLQLEDRALLRMSSGIEFDNRLWQTVLPVQTPVGVAWQAIGILDFDLLSSFQDKLAGGSMPAWEGITEPGLTLQLFEADFGGLQRCFAMMYSQKHNELQLWEATNFQKTDQGDRRIVWIVETPAYNWLKPFELKELESAEFWVDKVFGTVDIKVEFREDANPCWHLWTARRICTARDGNEAGLPPATYPVLYCEDGAIPVVLEKPPAFDCAGVNQRPVNIGAQFQLRLTVHGWCQIRGLRVFGLPHDRAPFENLNCGMAPEALLSMNNQL